jgi:dTDP-4-amino-4,6-dideoxygalactose transaminase
MRAEVYATLTTRWIGQGPKVEEFERIFAGRFAPPGYAAVATNSCTSALHLAYLLAGIKAGDDVICPLFTCTATNIPLLWIGARLHFCDVEVGGLNMDLGHLQRMRRGVMIPKAVVGVHYGGKRLNVPYNGPDVRVIEDCAQSLGGSWGMKSSYACYSFQAVKHVTTGDGGMLVLPEAQADEARRRRWFGIDRKAKLAGTWANDITEVGYKYQMTDIAAAMGIAGLETLDSQIRLRRYMRTMYMCQLDEVPGIEVIDRDPDSACWLMTVLVDRREDLRRKLAERGIDSDQVHYRNDRYGVFGSGAVRGQFPNMDAIEPRYLCLPMHANMTAEDVDRVCSVIREGW